MTYDELEEQYYVLSQRVATLEKENNSLILRNTELEGTNIVLENNLEKKIQSNEYLADQYQEEALKTINLKVQLESFERKFDSEIQRQRQQLRLADPYEAQAQANRRDFRHLQELPKFSVHAPMEQYAAIHGETNILHRVSDTFGFSNEFNANEFGKQFHTMAKIGDRVYRYSAQRSMLELQREEDFSVVLNQMTEGLKHIIIDEYSKSHVR
jgi:hypothetical protein